jgi:hypothetical protein
VPGILDQVELSLQHFVPRNQKEFVVLQIARRFSDTNSLAKYLLAAPEHPKKLLLEAARLATLEAPSAPSDRFFELLEQFRKEAR